MDGFCKVKNIDEIINKLKSKGYLDKNTPINFKPLLFISGFSSTLKTTIINRITKENDIIVIPSPVKTIDGLNHYYFNDMPINSITHFYSQFYSIYSHLVENPSDKYYLIERGLWDYLYFLKRFNFNHSSVQSLDELEIRKIIDRIFTLLNKKIDDAIVLLLKNDSDKLKKVAANCGVPTRRMVYNSVEEYTKYQDEYLKCVLNIMKLVDIEPIKVSITDELLSNDDILL